MTAAQLLPVLPLIYVVAAVVRRRGLSWSLLAGSVAYFAAVSAVDAIDPWWAVVVLAAAVGLVGLLRRRGRLQVVGQLGGLLLFAGLAGIALVAAPDTARYLVAAGWLGHAAWDLVHLRRRTVVSGSYAEWCAVFDVLMAIQLLALR